MRTNPFTRPTILAAVALLDADRSQAEFDHAVLRLALEQQIPASTTLSVSKKAALVAREVLQRGHQVVQTLDGAVILSEAVVREAVAITSNPPVKPAEQERFLRGLALDGFVVERSEGSAPLLRAMLPKEVDLPEADDEVHQLLKHFAFDASRGHLDQAIEAHTRGDWAAANGQTRTFIESLFEEIAFSVDASAATEAQTSENRRAMLAQKGFLSTPRNEWTTDGKNFLSGLFKMLHTEGSHPGLSDEDRSTFRLHVALLTARTFLRRLKNGS